MLAEVPVSRKRKKKRSGRSGRSRVRPRLEVQHRGRDDELARAFQNLAAYRDQTDRSRTSRAATMATGLVSNLTRAVIERPDLVVTDALCERIGALLTDDRDAPIDVHVDPGRLAEATLAAAEAAVQAALPNDEQTDTWRAPWRVLAALTAVLPYPHADADEVTFARLRALPAGNVLPPAPRCPEVTGPVLWTSDRYGSRFAVTAPIMAAEETAEARRWYLWDVDACGHGAFTVHSGFYPSSAAALADWQAAVGPTASAGTELAPVEDPSLVSELLPAELGFMRIGGENAAQFAEYHRCKRLAEAVTRALPRAKTRCDVGLTPAAATAEFSAWLRAHGLAKPPEGQDELVGELAESWTVNDIDALYPACSPHRVALCVLHMRNYYLDDFAEQLVALLPEWVRWLGDRNATAPELADRCLPYAQGQPHPQLGDDDTKVEYLARVAE
jgi:hypothetical protein